MNSNQFLASMERLSADPQAVRLDIPKVLAFQLISVVQLACRHPGFDGPTRANVEPLMRDLGRAISANDPDLRMLIEMGWQKQFDVPANAGTGAVPASNSAQAFPDPASWRCEHCQCTEEHACEGGCYWIHARLCSECATEAELLTYERDIAPLRAYLRQRGDDLIEQFQRERHYPFVFARTPPETSRIITP